MALRKSKQVAVIGIATGELRWVRTLVYLLRHPDPSIPELSRQALLYLMNAAAKRDGGPEQRIESPRTESVS